jgi:peptidoglycan/LPS O-acetylase OafA/YrhL
MTGATRPPSRTVRPGHVAWTAGAVGAIWLAVLLISLFSPDLVSGSEQQHLPIAAFIAWFWGAIATVVVILFGALLRRAAAPVWGVAPAAATIGIWVVAVLVSVFAPTLETGTDPTTIPLAAMIAPPAATLLTGVAYLLAVAGERASRPWPDDRT